MLSVLLGLSGAIVYGAADFVGGMAAKRISALRVTVLGAVSGLGVLFLMLPIFGGAWSAEAVMLGAITGVTGAAAIALLYACLAIGPMSILSPLTAVISAIVPLTAGLLRGERLEPFGYVAIGMALVAVVLVGVVPDRAALRPTPRALLMAVGAGVLIGVFLIIIDLTPDDSGLVPLIANRTTSASILFVTIAVLAAVAARRRSQVLVSSGAARGATHGGSPPPLWRPGLTLGLASGVADASANVLILLGLRVGDLSIIAVLTAMYPAGTIILAAIVLKERITPTQLVGLILAITAAALLALA
ncbi:MAG: hypothetical protein JWL94_125 [Microbacteriaceae bacterium]|jgi:drug/metabolite transporter (DMT)-like permease|nr:hypothetical protein [Microbacteriaceae bacterium]HEV7957194.1 EamA family transporter [Marisediminicola sp.]